MEMSLNSTYRSQIEALKEEIDFEERGDAAYLRHEDDEARLLWAFHRPSGSHPDQVSDKNVMVSIMAFNHSRLGAYERFSRVHPDVIADEGLRTKIRNRSRMLFRAMVDDDFKELMQVLQMAPVFLDQACDQMINGRIWNETYADLGAATAFLEMAHEQLDERLEAGVKRRLQPVKAFSFDEAKAYLTRLTEQAQKLHSLIKAHYAAEYGKWLARENLHPLQRIALQKQINLLKEGNE
jgi:hypothetical protein